MGCPLLEWGKTSSSTSSRFLSGIKPIVSTPLLPFLTNEGQSKDLLRRYHIYHSVSHISSCWNRIKRWRNLNFRLHLQFTLQIKGQWLWLSGSRMFSRRIRGCRCCQGRDFPYLNWLVWGMFSKGRAERKTKSSDVKNPLLPWKSPLTVQRCTVLK